VAIDLEKETFNHSLKSNSNVLSIFIILQEHDIESDANYRGIFNPQKQ
jgi:hypothetical protein